MISSFAVSVLMLVLAKNGAAISTHVALLVTIAVTTVCWVLTAWLGPETDRDVLIRFYSKVRPAGPGWKPVREAARRAGTPLAEPIDNIPLALVGWVAGCTTIWSALFTVGNVLYGRPRAALFLGAVFIGSGLVLLRVFRALWSSRDVAAVSSPARIGKSSN